MSASLSQYVQLASYKSDEKKPARPSFTHLSSQQMFPGSLVRFHTDHGRMIPMEKDELGDLEHQGAILLLHSKNNTSYSSQTGDMLENFFSSNVQSKHAAYRTPNMVYMNVPDHMTELRATDFS
jgi:hypothetical protein